MKEATKEGGQCVQCVRSCVCAFSRTTAHRALGERYTQEQEQEQEQETTTITTTTTAHRALGERYTQEQQQQQQQQCHQRHARPTPSWVQSVENTTLFICAPYIYRTRMLLLTADLRFTRDLVIVAHHTGLHALQRVDFVVVGVRNVSTYVGKALGGGRQAGTMATNKVRHPFCVLSSWFAWKSFVPWYVLSYARTLYVLEYDVQYVQYVRTYVRENQNLETHTAHASERASERAQARGRHHQPPTNEASKQATTQKK